MFLLTSLLGLLSHLVKSSGYVTLPTNPAGVFFRLLKLMRDSYKDGYFVKLLLLEISTMECILSNHENCRLDSDEVVLKFERELISKSEVLRKERKL